MNSAYTKDLVTNKKARYNYEILDTYEAGVALYGSEVKSLRNSLASIQEAYIVIKKDELWMINSSISPYSHGGLFNHEEKRERKLLMHSKEIEKLRRQIQEKGLSLIPLSIFLKNRWIKIKFGLAKGKKLYDKRQSIKEKEIKRRIEKVLKK